MLVKDVMTSPAVTVHADTSVKDGLRRLDELRVTSLPVTDGDGHILGIVSEADLLRDLVRPDPRAHLIPHPASDDQRTRVVAEVMSTLSMTVTADTDLSEAVELMTSTAVKSLPVVERGRVVGVVSRSDVVHVLARSDDRICDEVDDLLRSAGVEADVDVADGVVRIFAVDDPGQRRIAEVIAGSVAGVIAVEGAGI
ncbi:MAG TPA: CBS domain-containing protein [Nocardioidaceae bacterium]|nr:CBS domain-containing protein [Nocardioidaceae bacterium]